MILWEAQLRVDWPFRGLEAMIVVDDLSSSVSKNAGCIKNSRECVY